MDTKVRVVIQARMRSSRLPGKIMANLAGEPLLGHVVWRIFAASSAETPLEIVVATTDDPTDDVTEQFCAANGIACFRGAAEDVLDRYFAAASDLSDDDLVVRATADNPLYCPRRTAAIVDEMQVRGADYLCVERLSYVVPEVMRVGALRRMAALADEPDCREHVTPYFRRRQSEFDAVELPRNWFGLRPEIRFTVDRADELQWMQWIFSTLTPIHGPRFALERAYELCDQGQRQRRLAA